MFSYYFMYSDVFNISWLETRWIFISNRTWLIYFYPTVKYRITLFFFGLPLLGPSVDVGNSDLSDHRG